MHGDRIPGLGEGIQRAWTEVERWAVGQEGGGQTRELPGAGVAQPAGPATLPLLLWLL